MNRYFRRWSAKTLVINRSTMLTESRPYSRSDRGRFLWSLLASAVLNVFTWVALSAHLSVLRNVQAEEPRETLIGSLSSIRIERRVPQSTPQQPKIGRQPQRTASAPPQTVLLAPPQPASLSLPPGWARQDFGYLAATDTTTWLDWTKRSANWVPRVFLWQRKAEGRYMRQPSLQDAVEDILASLRAEDAKLYASRAQRVCGGQRPGWFLSYVKPSDDPPLHFDETLFMAGETIYRSTYIRAVDQPEDTKTREALNTLCWP
ncbi:MAG: hypothetical protein ACXVAM_18030 [Vulcanimicrobiaceae bacterium]